MSFAAPFIDVGLKAVYFEAGPDGKQIECWPCGDHVHKGDYAIYSYGHCNCPHAQYPGLFLLGPEGDIDPDEWQLMCGGCGMVFDWDAAEWDIHPTNRQFAIRKTGGGQ